MAENWQSEYLQFTLYIFGTVWLLQRGSPESKELDKAGLESDEDQGSARTPRRARRAGRAPAACARALYSNSLLIVMTHDLAGQLARRSRSPAPAGTTPSSSTTKPPR